MSLDSFLDRAAGTTRSLVVLNRTEPVQLVSMLEEAFAGQPVAVEEGTFAGYDENTVALVEDGEVVATSPLSALQETILLVNSDLYSTGASDFDTFELPAVIEGLDEVPFRLQGYPESNKEKLLLVVISRYIERAAYATGSGVVRSSFQRLSRLTDERGTREVYETLAGSGLDVHVYGEPDWTPEAEFPLTMHGGYGPDFQDSWFVLHLPEASLPADHRRTGGAGAANGEGATAGPASRPDQAGGQPIALCAIEVAPREWEGFWTFRPEVVRDLNEYVAHRL
jgi:hypothetical protein